MESPLIRWLCVSGPRVGCKFVLAATGLASWVMRTCGTPAAFPTPVPNPMTHTPKAQPANPFAALHWHLGPTTKALGNRATLKISPGFAYLNFGQKAKSRQASKRSLPPNVSAGVQNPLGLRKFDHFQ